MKYGICLLCLAPQRFEPSEKSEMVNQLLFGDTVTVIDSEKNWIQIKSDYDGYEGWIDKKMITEIDEELFLRFNNDSPLVNETMIRITKNNNSHLLLTPGCSIFNKNKNLFSIAEKSFEIDARPKSNIDLESITNQFLNTPYLWGGKSILGIDCSGLVQVIYKILGIKLPRDASEQSKIGTTVEFIQETKKGDLAYFDNEEGKITHVGILLNSSQIIHASGYVRIDKIDSHGIFNSDINEYTHKLRIIKRPHEDQ